MSLKISRILHAGYVFETAGAKIVFDPILQTPFSGNCYGFPDVVYDYAAFAEQEFSAVFISHYHEDHCCFESLNRFDKNTPIYMYCVHDEIFALLRELGFSKVFRMEHGQKVQINDILVCAYPALDFDIDCVLHIQHQNMNILNVVDSWIDWDTHQELCGLCEWDLVLWPFQSMRELDVLSPQYALAPSLEMPPEHLQQIRELKAKYVLASSCQLKFEEWSWYNTYFFPITYQKFAEQISTEIADTKCLQLLPGQSLFCQKLDDQKFELHESDALSWIACAESDLNHLKTLDYVYLEKTQISSTAEIAERFPALQEEEKTQVFDFLKNEMPRIYAMLNLEISEQDYFFTRRHYSLKIYDPNFVVKTFYYKLDAGKMQYSEDVLQGVDWHCEISAYKLLCALSRGESLSSIYLRVDSKALGFREDLQGSEADVLQDPLIQVLYTNQFANYQKYQLKNILKT